MLGLMPATCKDYFTEARTVLMVITFLDSCYLKEEIPVDTTVYEAPFIQTDIVYLARCDERTTDKSPNNQFVRSL